MDRPISTRSRFEAVLQLVIAGLLAVGGLTVGHADVRASYSTSQVVWDDDYPYSTYSVKIVCNAPGCTNQYGSSASQCLPTPNTITQDYNWWWVGSIAMYRYSSGNCSGSWFSSTFFSIPSNNANPWYCNDTTYGAFPC